MGAERTHPIKNERNCAHQFPSFVYRQDGHELSSSIARILSSFAGTVK
jgi:hypothetical protein